MSYPTVFVLINEYTLIKNLSKELREFGVSVIAKTNPQKFEELLEANLRVHGFVVDLEIENFEALTLYSKLVQSQKYTNVPFIFLTNDEFVKQSPDQTLFDNAILINKQIPSENIIGEIVNALRFPDIDEINVSYKTGAAGQLEEIGLERLMNFCTMMQFTGAIIVSDYSSTGVLTYQAGKVERVFFKNYQKEEALQALRNLNEASFRLEHKIYSMEDIIDYYRDTNNKQFTVNDILTDLFYFAHEFFGKKIGKQITEFIFKNKIYEYSTLFTDIEIIKYIENSQEKVQITGHIDNDQLDILINLFREIFFELHSQDDSIVLDEFFSNLDELQPYLKQFNILKKLNLTETAATPKSTPS